MKKQLSMRDINLILALVGVIVVVAVYLLVFQKFNEKNTALDATLAEKEATYQELKQYYLEKSKYITDTEKSKRAINSNLSRLPLGIMSEDFLVYIMDSTDKVGAKLQSVNFRDEAQLSSFTTVIDNAVVECSGYEIGAGFTGSMTYNQLKEYLRIIYSEDEDITYVDSFSLTSNAEDATLNVSFNLAKYFITYKDGEYIPVPVPYVRTGTSNPFASVE